MTFDGVTLVFDPAGPIDSLEGRTRPIGSAATTDDAESVVVLAVNLKDAAQTAELRIVPVRDAAGRPYPVSAEEQERRFALEEVVAASLEQIEFGSAGPESERLEFVNGVGSRAVAESGDLQSYEFAGMTLDDRFLVLFGPVEIPAGSAPEVVDALDLTVASIYVDGDSDAFGAACDDDAFLVADLTIPDGSIVEAGSEIVKSWRLRNSGSCTWSDGYSWVFGGGDPMTVIEHPWIRCGASR